MAFLHGKKTNVYLGGNDVSTYFNEISSTCTAETGETTTFGTTGDAKTYIVGIQDATVSAKGLFDGSVSAIDAQLSSIMTNYSDSYLTYAIAGLSTTNTPVKFGLVKTTSYQVSSPVGDVVSASADFQLSGGLHSGIGLPLTTVSAGSPSTPSGNSTSYDWLASSTNGGAFQYHLLTNTWTLNSQMSVGLAHSADNITFTSLASATVLLFGGGSGGGSGSFLAQIPFGTTINRYTRFFYTTNTGSGSFSFVSAFSRS